MASAKSSARTSMIGTWIRKNCATRSDALRGARSSRARGDVVVQPGERRAADELLPEQAQVGRVAQRGEEQQRRTATRNGATNRYPAAAGDACDGLGRERAVGARAVVGAHGAT